MGIHDGHRDRIRSRYIEYGLENFNDINVLELVLFYAIPRADTNVIAHALIDRFGSLDAVFDASIPELCEVNGVGLRAATLISLFPAVMRKYDNAKIRGMRFLTNSHEMGDYFLPKFKYLREEVLLMVSLDSNGRILSLNEVSSGVVNSVQVNTRRIVEFAIRNRASFVVIAHNHPDGLAIPSVEDSMMTKTIFDALNNVGIELLDHIVVAGDDFVSFADTLSARGSRISNIM